LTIQTAYALTNFGDPAITLSLAAILFGWLFFAVSPMLALRWTAAVIACGLALTGMLTAFRIWHDLFGPVGLRVPSGHVAGAALAYGALAVVAAHGASRRRRMTLTFAAAAVVATIAVTRLRLSAHTVSEVLIGGAAGLGPLAWFTASYLRAGRAVPAWGAATAAAGAFIAGAQGVRLDVWAMIRAVLLQLKVAL
jgi:hypothetical protein